MDVVDGDYAYDAGGASGMIGESFAAVRGIGSDGAGSDGACCRHVALLMNEGITSWFNDEVFAGIDSVMHDEGYAVSLFQHVDTGESRREFFADLRKDDDWAAVFVASFAVDPEEVRRLGPAHAPIIGINTSSEEGFDATISIDDEEGMYEAALHLIELGHNKIVYLCSDAVDSIHSSIDARRRGFVRACRTAEHSHDLRWRVISLPRGGSSVESALDSLIALNEFPDAICCQSDTIAIPLLLRLHRYGRHAPTDYSIIGFDDSTYADEADLTTMRQDPFAMGRIAAWKALKLIAGETPERPYEIVRARLVQRGTDCECCETCDARPLAAAPYL